MAYVSLLLEAPDRAWADRVAAAIERALGHGASVTLAIRGEELSSRRDGSPLFLTGVAMCERQADVLVAELIRALREFDVRQRTLDSGATQLRIRPRSS